MITKLTKARMIKFLWNYATDDIVKKLSRKYTYEQLFKEYIAEQKRIRLGYYD